MPSLLVLTEDVAAPPRAVWRVLTEIEQVPARIPAVLEAELLDGSTGYAVGARWREVRREFGRRSRIELEVVGAEPEHSTRIEAHLPGWIISQTFRLDPAPRGTTLVLEFFSRPEGPRATGRSVLLDIGQALQYASLRVSLRRELIAIARAAEQLASARE